MGKNWVVSAFFGENLTRITNSGASIQNHALWSPDGSEIIFSSNCSGVDEELYAVAPDATGFVQIVWVDIPDKTFAIYWADELTEQPVWSEISGPALADFADLGDTLSWTDRGVDPQMPPTAPGNVQKRFYKILAQ